VGARRFGTRRRARDRTRLTPVGDRGPGTRQLSVVATWLAGRGGGGRRLVVDRRSRDRGGRDDSDGRAARHVRTRRSATQATRCEPGPSRPRDGAHGARRTRHPRPRTRNACRSTGAWPRTQPACVAHPAHASYRRPRAYDRRGARRARNRRRPRFADLMQLVDQPFLRSTRTGICTYVPVGRTRTRISVLPSFARFGTRKRILAVPFGRTFGRWTRCLRRRTTARLFFGLPSDVRLSLRSVNDTIAPRLTFFGTGDDCTA